MSSCPPPLLYGLILAAGLSTRMGGSPKALRGLGGESMLALCARALREGGVERVIVVTGHESDAVSDAAAKLRLQTTRNPDYREGMFSSICAGLSRIADMQRQEQGRRPAAVFLLPVDAPLAQAWSVRMLAAYWQEMADTDKVGAERRVFIPCFAGRSGHPPLIGAARLQEVLREKDALSAQGGLRTYLAKLLQPEFRQAFAQGFSPAPPQVADGMASPPLPAGGRPCPPIQAGADLFFVPMPDEGLAGDLDRPEDCAKAEAFLAFTRERTLPSPAECLEWLHGAAIGENKLRHSVMVAAGAVLLGKALRAAGKDLDLPLTAAGGLLHDLVRKCSLSDRKCKAHARRAMDLLLNRGWRECALVAGAHTALPDAVLQALGFGATDLQVMCATEPKCPGGQTDEALFNPAPGAPAPPDPYAAVPESLARACLAVYLADKFFFMDRYVPMDERFDMVIERFNGDEAAIAAIRRRKQTAAAVNDWLKKNTGSRAEDILPHCREALESLANKTGEDASAESQWLRFLAGMLSEQTR